MIQEISSFTGPYRFLSNFWPVPHGISYYGEVYPTVEHAYQASKTLDGEQRRFVLESKTPAEAKSAGKTITLRRDWGNVRLSFMEDFVTQKFLRGTLLADQLAGTGDKTLVEGNYWGDTFWGVCKGVGENHLGKILMAVRTKLTETH